MIIHTETDHVSLSHFMNEKVTLAVQKSPFDFPSRGAMAKCFNLFEEVPYISAVCMRSTHQNSQLFLKLHILYTIHCLHCLRKI